MKPRVLRWRSDGRRDADRDDRGAAAIEFALIVPILLLLVFAMISFGMMLSFRQTLSQAAAEGARAAAVERDPAARSTEALDAVNDAMAAVDKECGSGGLVCNVGAATTCGSGQCITVTVTYAYRENPTVATAPFADQLLPEQLEYAATVRVS
ncbi:TadE/TadG family type IV pilus assembly protein [Nocardioides antri]|uniref:TadE/TadG family type IV pilus assembly protein n=1 Tax=Nocardioides antri TaxID=2607659 RepID=UPI00165F9DA9|nr:TadE/TadG family type IV pilus assembly protein [Nocardioides antri]